MNYLNEMGDTNSAGLVGVMAVSSPWNCMESCHSLEEPINSFLFNQHLTRNLVNMLYRYGGCLNRCSTVQIDSIWPITRCTLILCTDDVKMW